MTIDAAIAAAETPVQVRTVKVRVSSGRVIALVVPVDLSGQEALDLVGFVAGGLADELRKGRPPSRLFVPGRA